MRRRSNWKKCCLGIAMALALCVTGVMPSTAMAAAAEESTGTVITSMTYDNGPDFTVQGLSQGSFGFNMPKFNGGAASWGEVVADLGVNVKVDGVWKDIDSVSKYVYNKNWGHWSDSGFNGYWFKLTESLSVQLYSKSNPSVTLEYNLNLSKPSVSAVTGLAAAAGTTVSANRTGSGFIAFPNAVAGGSYPTCADDLVAYVKNAGEPDSAYVNIDNNAESGWIYDSNFGIEEYGYWFKVEESGPINVKLALKERPEISLVYDITYSDTARSSYQVYANGATTITANEETGAAGVVFPYLGGTGTDNLPTNKELDNFVIEYYNADSGQWVEFANSAESGWYYQGNGYLRWSDKNQWGYFDDYVYGLWFQPITENFRLRIGYPESGVKGGAIGSNYIEYEFIGAPNAYRPPHVDIDDIIVGGAGSDPDALEGWDLYYNDEFSGNTLDMSSWSYNTGHFIDPSEPGTAGWGNNEAEYYTDEADNIFVQDGSLHLVAKYDPHTFTCTDAAQTQVTANYSSGKIISKDKVSFTYGRIDFRAKLPAGKGLWPALWLLPNDDTYGTWAASGEIDVMEARGRVPNSTSGTIHYGGQWPDNKYTGLDYVFPEGSTFDDGYHVYSVIWEEDNITWYVDGEFFSYLPKEAWYSSGSSSDTAPFDQDFYIIMNLAVGGWFDGGVLPDSGFTSAEMLVDYVRVYKEEGSTDVRVVPIEGLTLDSESITLKTGQTANLTKVYAPSNTTQRNVIWTSSDEAVATVSAGQITAVSEGTAVITATSSVNPAISASCTVTVEKQEGGGTEIPPVEDPDDPIVVTDEYGVIKNSDGTLTFYVKAEDTAFAPMLYWGVNKTNPVLSDLGGLTLTKNPALGADYFSYTTEGTYGASDVISYMFSYTPLGASGRIDSAIMSKAVSEMTAPAAPEEEPDGEYGVKHNADGTLTFYVYANEQEYVPLVYWGLNKTNPTLGDLGGYVMERAGDKEGYFTYTTAENVSSGSSVSYMFGYTPLGESGRRDTAIITETVN